MNTQTLLMEYWLPVPKWEGYYEVSDKGRVRSLDREVDQRSKTGNVCKRRMPGRLLKATANARGYRIVHLYRLGFKETYTVHRLVMLTFKSDAWKPGLEVCHGPGGVSDNSLENLYWCTHKHNNSIDKARDGSLTLGERNAASRLTSTDVLEIRALAATGEMSRAEIARAYGVSASNIDQIVWRKTWRHIGAPCEVA